MAYVKLEMDVKEFVKHNIKKVSNVNDLFKVYPFTVTREVWHYDSDCHHYIERFKKVLQLTINVFNNRDINENIGFKTESKDVNCPHSLDSNYVRDESNCLWRCVGRPTVDHVEDAVYNYVLCFRMIEMKKEEEADDEICCCYCDTKILSNETQCSSCETSLEEIMECHGASASTKNTVTVAQKQKKCQEKVTPRREDRQEKKWKCACLKEYKVVKCGMCSGQYKKAWWHCGKCSTDSDGVFEPCDLCGQAVVCAGLVTSVDDGDHGAAGGGLLMCPVCGTLGFDNVDDCLVCTSLLVEPTLDGWWCEGCGSLHPYTVTSCDRCDVSRVQNGSWSCTKCTFINRCVNVMCEMCNATNDRLLSKYCEQCRTNKIGATKVRCQACEATLRRPSTARWRCTFTKCNDWNVAADLFCRKCCLYRDFSHNRGDVVRQWSQAGDNDVWICCKCFMLNSLQNSGCVSCKGPRYEMKYCYACQTYKDGTLFSCDKCNKRL